MIVNAYIVVFGVSTIALFGLFLVARGLIGQQEYLRWAIMWTAITAVAFVAHNYWLFSLLTVGILAVGLPMQPGLRVAAYLFLLPTLPVLQEGLGVPGVHITYPRLLALVALVPLLLSPQFNSQPRLAFFSMPLDKWVAIFCVLAFFLAFRDTSWTNGMKAIWPTTLDILVPYYFVSRSLRDREDFKRAFFAVFASALVLASVAVFESLRGWLFYTVLQPALGLPPPLPPLYRGVLRAQTTFFSPIVLGYFLTLGFAAWLFLLQEFKSRKFVLIAAGVLGLGLLASVSRGPWLGAIMFFVAYLYLYGGGKRLGRFLPRLAAGSAIIGIVVLASPIGDTLLESIPYLGGTSTIDYREELFQVGFSVVMERPFFGYPLNQWAYNPEMHQFWQFENVGIEAYVDVVNTYLAISLDYGFVGLSVFLIVFLSILWRARRTMKHYKEDAYMRRIGAVLVCTIISILVTIGTVSPPNHVALYCWLFAAIFGAYNMMPAIERRRAADAPTSTRKADALA